MGRCDDLSQEGLEILQLQPKKIIVAITGATGALYGLRLLLYLSQIPELETHVIVSDAGVLSSWQDAKLSRKDFEKLATHMYRPGDISAPIASGSFLSGGMIVAPCSTKTLAAIAGAYSDNLVHRAAEVILKERRRLVLLVREAPLTLAHLRNMTAVTEMGGVVFPPVPAFYHNISTLEEMVDVTIWRVLDLFGIHDERAPRWSGLKAV